MIDKKVIDSKLSNVLSNALLLAKFYQFKVNNSHFDFTQAIQIFLANPNVTICKSFDEWNMISRRIEKGAKGILYFDADNPSKRNFVFDISQTYGVDFPPEVLEKREDLVSDINNMNYVKRTSFSTGYNNLLNVVEEYNLESGYSLDCKAENEFLNRFVSIFINATFNNAISIPEQVELEDIDLERKIDLCFKAEEIATELKDNILSGYKFEINKTPLAIQESNLIPISELSEEERLYFETNNPFNEENTLEEKVVELETNKEVKKNEQIRNFSPKLSKKSPSEQVSLFDFNGNTARFLEFNRQTSENIARQDDEETSPGVTTNEQFYGKITPRDGIAEFDRTSDYERYNLSNLENYKLTDLDFIRGGGAKTRCRENIAAIKLVKLLENEDREPTREEQKILAKYIGWGGIPQVFDKDNESYQKEYTELKELLSDSEYENAKGSVLSAHFTNKTIIDGMYNALAQMGFTNGSILEPAVGTGNFIGLLPTTFDKSKITGVEIDKITGKIAKYLYPESNIEIKGFEETNFINDSFDSVITNVPFGSFKVYDRDYNRYDFFIHDYFIAKSIDKVKPNGIVAVITSKGTMDKANTSFRKYVADRANLLGAIRLPNNAFDNAGTKVTTDILFFQKRGTMIDSNDSWIYTGVNENGIPMNEYFLDNPNMLLGTMQMGKSMYGGNDETYLEPFENIDLKTLLSNAIQKLPKNIYKAQTEFEQAIIEDNEILPADYTIRNYCYKIIDNNVYQRIDNQMVKQKVAKTNIDRFLQMTILRDEVRKLLDIQISNCSDDELQQEQYKLNSMYDKFTKKYGFLNSKFNRNLFREDADYPLLVSLENYNEQDKTATKTDIFTKRTIRIHNMVESASNALEGLQISKNELGKVDIHYIEKLTGLSYDDIIEELKSSIYKNPIYENMANENEDLKYIGWETADEYLSGNVKQKLKIAEMAVKENPIYEKNVEALKQAQPEEIPASDISVRLGATWVDKKYYIQFLCEKLKVSPYAREDVDVQYNNFDGTFKVVAPGYYKHTLEATNIYGTDQMDAFKIAEHSINLQTVTIYDYFEEDGHQRREVNKRETILAREKQRKIEQEFKDWIFDDQIRRNELVKVYNDTFNNTRLQTFNGDYLTFPEMNPLIELKKHQLDAVDRIITSGNTLLHHVVGAGKTFEIAAAAMKLKQYGLAHKPMIVVPNHLVMQWTREFKKLYPNANVLMATKKDLEKTNRLKFVSRVATGDWDAVIIASSSFEKIPISKARQERKLNEELQAIEQALYKAKEEGNRLTIKMLEQTKHNKEVVLKKLMENPKDDLIKFEDLGVDYLFVDEAHKYKNKFIFTKMNNVAGISRAMSQRATDLDMKCEFINDLHGGDKGVVFATGTPISNSMVEMFTMQSYMQRRKLNEVGLNYFDAWAAAFGETQTALELAPSGNGYRTKTRFSKFTNLPELLKMYRSFADVKTADQLDLPVPKAIRETIVCKPSEGVLKLNDVIQERAEKIEMKSVKPEEDNMLKITSDGKKLALDPRCFDEYAEDDEANKLNFCVKNVYEIWKKTSDNKSTQVIFCDLSTPKKNFEEYDKTENFDVYNDIKTKLVERGIPVSEIRFIHEANTDLQKQTLFDDVTNGKVRVLIGSTEKCGAGTNIQNKLIALHHLDTPYRPSDLEQREGRIIRQGNSNDEVYIYTYVTERTFDSYSYQILENKQKFISQINNGNLTIREASDIDETTLSYAEIKAITTANPKIKEKMELEQELSRLRTLEGEYKSNKYSLQDKIAKTLPEKITTLEIKLTNLKKDIETRNNNVSEEFSIKIGNKTFDNRSEAGDYMMAIINSGKYTNQVIGNLYGFNIVPLPYDTFFNISKIALVGDNHYNVETSTSGLGNIIRLENQLKELEKYVDNYTETLKVTQTELDSAKEEVNKPFEYAASIANITARLDSLNAELDLNKQEIGIVIDEDNNGSEINKDCSEVKDGEDYDNEEDGEFEKDLEM